MQLKILHENELRKKVCVVLGTRPGIVMFSPIIRELERRKLDFFIIHTGQHYSYNMDRRFFEDLKLPEPAYRLDTVRFCRFHGEQTAEMLKGCEQVLLQEKPKLVLVGGDANTNLAGALAARKLHVRVGHVEAGERSYDWRMPEEHNRVMIDHISDYLFATGEKAQANLLREHVRGKIFITGNPIVDACYQNVELARERDTVTKLGVEPRGYILMTLHREENVDNRDRLIGVLEGLRLLADEFGYPILFLVHPRTRKRLKEFDLLEMVKAVKGLRLEEPVGYLDFLNLLQSAALVLTDSGGVQQEACILGIPCVTLRENTEWVETLEIGANVLAGVEPEAILRGVERMMKVAGGWSNPFGDGRSAERIIDIIEGEVLA